MNLKTAALFSATLLFSVSGCKKETSPGNTNVGPPVQNPTISSIRPTSGSYNSLDTIVGTNFSTKDSVWINGVLAQVITVSQDTLIVKIPKAGGTGTIKITSNSSTTIGPDFNYVFSSVVSTFAGNGVNGYVDGMGSSAEFMYPTSIAFDNKGNLYVAETQGNRIRKITPDGTVSTVAGDGLRGWIDGTTSSAEFNNPYGIICDPSGNLYVGDTFNGYIRQITTAGIVNTLSANGLGFVDQPAVPAQFTGPLGLAIDKNGVLYVADGNKIKTISLIGAIDTIAGTINQGYIDGLAANSEFKAPAGLAFDGTGNLYIADTYNSVIRKYTSAGQVSTIAGSGTGGFLDSTALNAEFLQPQAMVVDSVGNIYVGDYANARVRKIGIDGTVTTVAGNGTHAYVDSNAGIAEFYSPWGLAIDSKGNIYVADSRNDVIRKISFE